MCCYLAGRLLGQATGSSPPSGRKVSCCIVIHKKCPRFLYVNTWGRREHKEAETLAAKYPPLSAPRSRLGVDLSAVGAFLGDKVVQ